MRRFLLLSIVAVLGLHAQSVDVLLQRANQKESVDGDLKGAIELYKRAARQAGSDRAAGAKALLRLAECYEKQGNQEARRTYEQIARDFADQAEVVSIARARLGRTAGREVQVRKLFGGPSMGNMGSISPDGRLLAYVKWDVSSLALFDTTTGQSRLLTKPVSWLDGEGWPDCVQFSPDGKQVAYWWYQIRNGQDHGGELRIQSVAGGPPRVLLEYKKDAYIYLFGWLPGGTHLLGIGQALSGQSTMKPILISVSDGSRTEIDVDGVRNFETGISPDGRYLAVTRYSNAGNRDIQVVPLTNGVKSGPIMPLVTDPSDDWFLGWLPSGDHVLFASNRTGTINAYVLPVKDGKPSGNPVLVRDNIGNIKPAGFDHAGRFYYHPMDALGAYDIHIAGIDTASGKLSGPPMKIPAALTGNHRAPSFSPDGHRLAYYRGRTTVPASGEFVLFNIASQSERTVPLPPDVMRAGGDRRMQLLWLPDGKLIAAAATSKVLMVDWESRKAVNYPVSLRDVPPGSAKSCKSGGGIRRDFDPVDHYSFISIPEGVRWRVQTDATASITEPAFDLSPDCSQLASTNKDRSALLVGPAGGGEARILLRLPAGERIDRRPISIRWTADGRYIILQEGEGWKWIERNLAHSRCRRRAGFHRDFRGVASGNHVK